MGSSAPRTTTVREESSNEPWAPAQPYLQAAMQAAYGQFQQGPPAPFPGQTMAPMSTQTQAGLQQIQNNASLAPNLANQQLGTLGRVMNQGPTPGTGNLARSAMGMTSNPFTGQIADLGSSQRTQPDGIGMQALGQFASGQMMQNPFLDATFDSAARQVEDRVNSRMALAGRTGSGAHQSLMTRGLSDLGTQIYGQAYDQDMGRRLGAAGQRAGLEQSGFNADRSFGLNALNSAAGLVNQDFANALNAFQGLSQNQAQQNAQRMQASAALPGVYEFGRQGAQDLMGVGSSLEGYEQALIDDARNRYDYINQAPWDYISRLNAIASGQGQLGGTQIGNRQMPYQASNPFLQGLGAAGSAASAISSIASLFAASDPALKRDAKPIATDDRGVTWHEYAYAWDAPGVKRVGVMADELEAIAPQFVVTGPDGFRRVDYGALAAWEG